MRRRKTQTETAASPSLPEGLGSHLQGLRCAQDVTQAALAQRLGISQTALSHLERRDDVLLSTLTAYVQALGGSIHVAVTFPERPPVLLSGDATWKPVGDTHAAGVEDVDDGQLCLPDILIREQSPPSRDVVFSIRPKHAEKILDGSKTVELRRRFTDGVRPGTLALIYATSPTRALTGCAKIEDVQHLKVRDLWEKHRAAACLLKGDFEAYFSGLDRGYAIVLSSARPLARPVGLSELRDRFGFEPPQSYQYASPNMRGLVEHDRPQDHY